MPPFEDQSERQNWLERQFKWLLKKQKKTPETIRARRSSIPNQAMIKASDRAHSIRKRPDCAECASHSSSSESISSPPNAVLVLSNRQSPASAINTAGPSLDHRNGSSDWIVRLDRQTRSDWIIQERRLDSRISICLRTAPCSEVPNNLR